MSKLSKVDGVSSNHVFKVSQQSLWEGAGCNMGAAIASTVVDLIMCHLNYAS